MDEKTLKAIQDFTAKYQIPEINRIVNNMIKVMIKMRYTSNFEIEVLKFTDIARQIASKHIQARKTSEIANFHSDFLQLNNILISFPHLSNKGIESILQHCEELAPEKENTLEKYLCSELKLRAYEEFLTTQIAIQYNNFAWALPELTAGFANEKFILKSTKRINTDIIINKSIAFYKNHGFTSSQREHDTFTVRKNGKYLNVVISNYGEEIYITVTAI